MPARNLPCPDPVKLQRNGLAVEHCHQPAHRPHKALMRLAPVHTLRPVDRGEFLRQSLRENIGRASALPGNLRRKVFALRGCNFLQLRHVDSSLLGKRMRRGRGLTILISDTGRRPGHLLADVRLSRGDASCNHCQSPRCIEICNLVRRQSLAAEQGADALAQFKRSGIDHPRRNLFAPDFQQKVWHAIQNRSAGVSPADPRASRSRRISYNNCNHDPTGDNFSFFVFVSRTGFFSSDVSPAASLFC